MFKKRFLISTIVLAMMCSLGACAQSEPEAAQDPSPADAAQQQEESPQEIAPEASANEEPSAEAGEEGITVVDQNGMTVTFDEPIQRVVTTALPLPSVYAVTGAAISNIVGMHPGSESAIENSVMAAMYPELLGIPSGFIEGEDINIEELLKLSPDVVMYWAEYMNQYEVMSNAGIKAVGVKTQGDGDALVTLESWLEIMGTMFGTTGNTDEVIAYGNQMKDEIQAVVGDLPEEEKPRTLILFNHSSEDISVSGGNHYGQVWIGATGGVNVSSELSGTPAVNMEQIYQWNPDVIIISTFTETMPEDLINNTISGQDWSQVKAVQEGKVYKEPLGVYRWYPPSGDAPLMLKWMAQTQHPDLFTYDMKTDIIDYYKQFYGYDLTDEQAEGILASNAEAARGSNWGQSK